MIKAAVHSAGGLLWIASSLVALAVLWAVLG